MIDSAECMQRAKDCADHARLEEVSQKFRSLYSDMARSWTVLANQIERQAEVRRDKNWD
jgi:hypothetical protein